ncbi:helix-turn-helix domain-containing protein [Bdellovibrionota bacterium FG-2]
MGSLAELHPAIQCAILHSSDSSLTFEEIGQKQGISKQAAQKQFVKAWRYLQAYTPGWESAGTDVATEPCPGCGSKETLIHQLKRELILAGVRAQLLKFFRESVLKFFPRFKVTRLPAWEKKRILDWLEKFKRAGGGVRDFAAASERSPETLARWQEAYEKHGLAGLTDKRTRPKNFGNKVPLWIRNHLITLFIQFPCWTPYQYHSYIRHNPATRWYVSLPTIQKLKNMHKQASEQEKERIAKRWCFAPGTSAWTVDFVCLLKTDTFKLHCFTVSDHRSRFLIHTALYLNTSTDTIIAEMEALFLRHGKPYLIKADNGPEFRVEFRDQLKDLSVYLINNPQYYGQFNGAHERIHRKMRAFITPFEKHGNLMRLVDEIKDFQDQYNYKIPMDTLDGKTPSEIFLGDGAFTTKGAEIVTPYEKDGELRMKFTNRDGHQARIDVPIIPPESGVPNDV